MAATAAGDPPLPPKTTNPNQPFTIPFVNLIKPNSDTNIPKVPPKPVIFLQGEPNITWKSSEIKNLIIQENLQYAVLGKFSYGKPEIGKLRKYIPSQCGIKGACNIGLLDSRHVLIRLSLLEDYVQMLSTPVFELKDSLDLWQMRTLKWDPWFEPEVETSIGVAWISFPDLPPNFFARDALFSIASAVGRPLTVDMATKNKTRPSCAKVKVEVDLLAKLPQRIRINEENDSTGELKSKWINIQYDYMPKYCKECSLQGHDEWGCWKLNPELKKKQQMKEEDEDEIALTGQQENTTRTLKSGKVVGNTNQHRGHRRRNRNNRHKERNKANEKEALPINTTNSFSALEGEQPETGDLEEGETSNRKAATKEMVQKIFGPESETTQRQEEDTDKKKEKDVVQTPTKSPSMARKETPVEVGSSDETPNTNPQQEKHTAQENQKGEKEEHQYSTNQQVDEGNNKNYDDNEDGEEQVDQQQDTFQYTTEAQKENQVRSLRYPISS